MAEQYTVDIPAGPIWSNEDAQQKCLAVCAAQGGKWNGHWTTVAEGLMSVCGCTLPSVVGVYATGLFGTNDQKTNDEQLAQLQASAFNSFIFWSVHVHANGDLIYNNTPLVTGGTFNADLAHMQPYVAKLREQGQIWWSVGSWGATDFKNIGTLLQSASGTQALTDNFRALFTALPGSGVDFDMEESYGPDMQNTIVTFTQLLFTLGLQSTYCPYANEPFWLNCLAGVYAAAKAQLVQRFNLQCYAGGDGNTTSQWYTALQGFTQPLGISDPSVFIVPGNWVRSDDGSTKFSPTQTCAFFSNKSMREDAGGGFLWKTSEIFTSGSTAQQYAQAVSNGIQNKC
jgi:hypothetical protein